MKYCLIIPHYNHDSQFIDFLPKLVATGLPCIVVDDGSDESSFDRIKKALSEYDQVFLFSNGFNRGKGAAIRTGICHARHLGFTHVIQIDADGQHAVEDVPLFVEQSKKLPGHIICGRPTFDKSVPKIRLYGRKITDFWVVLETFSLAIKDGLCGFRVYPVRELEEILDHYYMGSRMDYDTEVLVKAVWFGTQLKFIDTQVKYPEFGVSHFKYVRDNILLVRLHVRLMVGMLVRLPLLVYRALGRARG